MDHDRNRPHSFAKGRGEIVELEVKANGPLDGMLLHEMPQKLKVKVRMFLGREMSVEVDLEQVEKVS